MKILAIIPARMNSSRFPGKPLKKINALVYGPADAPISRIRGRHRIRLLVKAAKVKDFQKALTMWIDQIKLPGNVRLTVDIDPQTFF